MCVYLCMCVQVPMDTIGVVSSEGGVRGACGCLEVSFGPLREQCALLTDESSLQHLTSTF